MEADFKRIRKYLKDEFGIALPDGRMFVEGKKVFIYTGGDIDLRGRYGLYIGSTENVFRPSFAAAQLATKGFVDVDGKQASWWMCGLDIEKEAGGYYAIVRYKEYILGVGKPKDGKIINNLPKNRRLPLGKAGKEPTF